MRKKAAWEEQRKVLTEKNAAEEEKTAWEKEWGELPENGEILLICRRKAELEAKQLLRWGKPSRYNYCELLISHLYIDSLLFLTVFLGIDSLIGAALYHVHYKASRDIGCIFFIWIGLWFFHQYEPIEGSWNVATFGSFLFLFPMLCFLGCLPIFFCGYFGCMALWVPQGDYDREVFLNAIETWVPNLKENSRLSGSGDWCFMGVNWDPTIISVTACIWYSNSVATTICVAKTPTFFNSFLRFCHFGTISMISLFIMKLKPPKIRKWNWLK